MKVLVAGADGQLGRCLQEVLKSREIEFLPFSRSTLDVTNLSQVRKAVKGNGINVLINASAYTNVEQAEIEYNLAFEINEIGPQNLAIAARENNSKFIHFSTDYVFSGKRKTPWEIDSSVCPISVYGKSKLAGEIAVFNEYPDNSLVLRTAWLYSKYGKNFYKSILGLATRSNNSINVVNDQIGQPTNALELARLAVSTLHRDIPAGTYHASNAGSATWFDFALYIFQLAGADTSRIKPISTSDYSYKASRPEYSVLDNSVWIKLGIEPLGPWRDSVAKAFPTIEESLI